MTNNRLVAISYVVLGLLAGFFLEHVLLAAFGSFSRTQPLTTGLWETADWSPARLIALAIAAIVTYALWMRMQTRDVAFEIADEMRKVSWPSMAETRAATVAVIIASLIAAALLGTFDVAWQYLTDKIQNPSL